MAGRRLLGLLQFALAAGADYTVSSADRTLALTISAASGRVVGIAAAWPASLSGEAGVITQTYNHTCNHISTCNHTCNPMSTYNHTCNHSVEASLSLDGCVASAAPATRVIATGGRVTVRRVLLCGHRSPVAGATLPVGAAPPAVVVTVVETFEPTPTSVRWTASIGPSNFTATPAPVPVPLGSPRPAPRSPRPVHETVVRTSIRWGHHPAVGPAPRFWAPWARLWAGAALDDIAGWTDPLVPAATAPNTTFLYGAPERAIAYNARKRPGDPSLLDSISVPLVTFLPEMPATAGPGTPSTPGTPGSGPGLAAVSLVLSPEDTTIAMNLTTGSAAAGTAAEFARANLRIPARAAAGPTC